MTTKNQYVYEFRTRRIRRSVAMDAPAQGIAQPATVAHIVRHITKGDARETFFAFLLDAKNSLLGYEVVAIGGLSQVDVHPREVFRPAIVAPAASIVLAHNHPSNSDNISTEDIELTERMNAAGQLLGIPLLDHVIVTEDSFVSLLDRGLIRK